MMRYEQESSKVYIVWYVMLSNYIFYPFHSSRTSCRTFIPRTEARETDSHAQG